MEGYFKFKMYLELVFIIIFVLMFLSIILYLVISSFNEVRKEKFMLNNGWVKEKIIPAFGDVKYFYFVKNENRVHCNTLYSMKFKDIKTQYGK